MSVSSLNKVLVRVLEERYVEINCPAWEAKQDAARIPGVAQVVRVLRDDEDPPEGVHRHWAD